MSVRNIEGKFDARNSKFAIVAGRFNSFIVEPLVQGAVQAIEKSGGNGKDTDVYWAPGAFEIPQLLKQVLKMGKVDGVICLGAVIRGATPHFDFVAQAANRGIEQLALESGLPIGNGVLTCDSIDQAIERSGTKAGNKGFEAAMAVIEMADLFKSLKA